jgi:hypothetical protein
MLVFWAYGLALTRAARWQTLHDLFGAQIAREYKEPKRTIDLLFLWDWEGSRKDIWQKAPGQENKIEPLSDYLFGLFSDWSKSFVGLSQEFEVTAARFELLGALASLESTPATELRQALSTTGRDAMVRMPVGRVGFRESIRDRLLQELRHESLRPTLLKAGFGLGSADFIDLFIENFNRISARMRW